MSDKRYADLIMIITIIIKLIAFVKNHLQWSGRSNASSAVVMA